MFTGIIEAVGTLTQGPQLSGATSAVPKNSELELEILTPWDDLSLGESVAVLGVCLTVTQLRGKLVRFYVSPETLSKTRLGRLTPQAKVSLERALLPTTRLSGHWVQGHVDGLAEIVSIDSQESSYLLTVDLPRDLGRYCIQKGSIALDGVSLTINEIKDQTGAPPGGTDRTRIQLMIIPHTWSHTHFSELKAGNLMHVEVDLIAKYVERLCQPI
jgi:riboflavin synthase